LMGELAMSFAPNTAVFIFVGRVLVGLGASFLIPSVLGIVPALYEKSKRVFAYGCVTAGTGAAALMPVPFGIMLDTVGFRVTFAVMAGLFLVLLVFSIRLPKIERQTVSRRFDVPGFVACSIGFFFLLVSITCISTCGIVVPLPTAPFTLFGIAPTLPMATFGILSLVVFSRIEKSREAKGLSLLMPRSFLGTSAARHSLVAVAFGFFLSGAFNLLIIPYLQIAAGLSALESGLMFACAGVPMVVCAVFIPKLFPAVSPRRIIQLGYCVGAVGCFTSAFGLGQSNLVVYVAVGMFLAGVGIGLVNSHASYSVACSVGEKDVQQSGGIQGTVRNIAHSLAAAVLGTLLVLVLTVTYPIAVAESPALTAVTKDILITSPVSFSSDVVFEATLASAGVSADESEPAMTAYRQARLEANQLSLAILGCGTVLLLLFTRNLPMCGSGKRAEKKISDKVSNA
ncbi:MAG: MFS transporter, partial [Raoultibacter sp.]